MRISAIDIGTNTTFLLIAEINPKREVVPLLQQERITRLGEQVSQTGSLKQSAMERRLMVLKEYKTLYHRFGAEKILVCGTEALRSGKNRELFLAEAEHAIGAPIYILSNQEEAYFSYLATQKSFPFLKDPLWVLDIGGGSTELIWGSNDEMEGYHSFQLGSVSLTEKYIRSDPLSEEEGEEMRKGIQKEFQKLNISPKGATLVGVAGTVTTITTVARRIDSYDGEGVHGTVLTREELEEGIQRLRSSTAEDRENMVGLHPERADVALAGAILLWEVIDWGGWETIYVSNRGVRFGILYDSIVHPKPIPP